MAYAQPPAGTAKCGESQVQHQVRLLAARKGAIAWRNNVGATPARCRECGAQRRPVRYGLANDSGRLNDNIKSSDLILAIPRTISPTDVGKKIAQFGAVETKAPGWRYSGKGAEAAQAAWLALVQSLGGYAAFSQGEIWLDQINSG